MAASGLLLGRCVAVRAAGPLAVEQGGQGQHIPLTGCRQRWPLCLAGPQQQDCSEGTSVGARARGWSLQLTAGMETRGYPWEVPVLQ